MGAPRIYDIPTPADFKGRARQAGKSEVQEWLHAYSYEEEMAMLRLARSEDDEP